MLRSEEVVKEKGLPSCNRASFWRLPVRTMHVESWRDDVKWVVLYLISSHASSTTLKSLLEKHSAEIVSWMLRSL